MARILFDVEANGLLDTATKMHVFSWVDLDDPHDTILSTYSIDEAVGILEDADEVVGHFIIGYDLPLLSKLGLYTGTARQVDTLPLSWYLRPNRPSHNLDDYGRQFGTEKVKITDWDALTPEDYRERCEQDVRINLRLYRELMRELHKLYYDDVENSDRLIDYLSFKMTCAAQQAEIGWKVDVEGATALRDTLAGLKSTAEEALASVMPEVPIIKKKGPPKVMYKQDGNLSAHGESWLGFLWSQNLPETTSVEVTYIDGNNRGNPNSPDQIKEWLFSHGWYPDRYKYLGSLYDGTARKIPQVKWEGELTRSVQKLAEDVPEVKYLEDLSVITHRLGVVQGFLDNQVDGVLEASVTGLTNTFRFKHSKPLVNIPGVDKPWGKEIRSLLITSENNVLCGADMVSLEDTTKRHYMQPLDPSYVEEMSKPGFDPHLDLAKYAGVVTQDDIDKHNEGKTSLKAIRKSYKAANYACIYGVKEGTLSIQTGLSKPQAKKLIEAYWERNWAIAEVSKRAKVVERIGLKWVWNPVSRFWMNLRYEKDRWSTINQSTGVYCFDTWLKYCTEEGMWPCGQFHDEGIWDVPEDRQDTAREVLEGAIQRANEELKLNVELGIDTQFGKTYAEIH